MTTMLSSSLTGPMAQAIGWALLHLLWQGVLVAAILAATLALMKRQSANARYLASCGAMIALLVLLVATAARSYDPGAASAPAFPATISMHAATLLDTTADLSLLGGTDTPTTGQLFARAVTVAAPWLPLIVLVWATGVLLLSVRLLFGWIRAHELARRNAVPAGRDWQRAAARLADALGLRRGVELLESAAVEVPTVIGFLRPVILLPMATLSGLSTDQIEMILAHELAHIRRHDFLINLLQAVVETLLFYHPAVWWISHRARVEREHCCDDMAVAVCGNALQYARALTRLEEMRVDPVHAFIAANGGSLMTRIRRLIGERGESTTGPSRWAAGAALLAVLLALLAAPSIPLLADRQHADNPPPAPAAKAAHSEVTVQVQKVDSSDDPTEAEPSGQSDTEADDAPSMITIDSDTPEPPEPPEPPAAAPSATCPTPAVPPVPAVAPFRGRVPRPAMAPMAVVAPRIAVSVAPRMMAVVAPNVRAIVEGVVGGVTGGVTGGVIGGIEGPIDFALDAASDDHDDDKDSEHHGKHKSRMIGSGDKLSVDELIWMRASGVTPEYIQQMRNAGLGELTYGDVIGMRANGVTPEYLAEMRKAGFEVKSARMVIGMHANGVTPEYVRGMREAGVDVKETKEIVALRANGVTPEWIASMKHAGLTGLSARELMSLRANGVDAHYITAMNEAGYKNLSMRDLVSLKATGVSPAFIKAMADAGYTNLSVHDLIRLAASGVNSEYIHDLQKYRTNK
jgi:beta-lactamase regulating signal transducer with metallopeptidase domain